MRESAYDKATRYLAEHDHASLEAGRHGIAAKVRGEGHVYVTRWLGDWTCSCENPRPTCSHIAAVKRVTAVDLREGR